MAIEGLPAWAQPAASSESAPVAAGGATQALSTASETRGLGVYPGAPADYFGPELFPDSTTYRNLALLRPAYHSSSYDYNLTAQLVTDGIRETRMPEWVVVTEGQRGILPKELREDPLDHANLHMLEMRGEPATLTIELGGGGEAPEVDRVQLSVIAPDNLRAESLRFAVIVSDDGRAWEKAGETVGAEPASLEGCPPGFAQPGRYFRPWVVFSQALRKRFHRFELDSAGATGEHEATWRLAQIAFHRGKKRVNIGGPYSFTSAWRSAGLGEEWVCVDLGARCTFDRVKLYWIARAAEGAIQTSEDGVAWRSLASIEGGSGLDDDVRIQPAAEGRYVRVLMTRPSSPNGYILSELEVYGRGGFIARPRPMPEANDGTLPIAGGGWRVQRASLVRDGGEALSKRGFADSEWLVATVPGTVLTSYLNAGAIPDPNFGENQLHISDSYFCSDFWYRTEFDAPSVDAQQKAWLNFGGVNWKAEVYLNGEKLGRIEGGFLRGRFDVTAKLLPGRTNALAVKIEANETPGSTKQKTLENVGHNGGALGADNPTYHASIGWDWIPTIRGRNTGIWGAVTLEVTGNVTIENPYAWSKLPLPDTSSAEVYLETELVNHQAKPFKGMLRARFGDIHLQLPVVLSAGERKTVRMDPATHEAMKLNAPRLWWPAGYGEPYLYEVVFSLEAGGKRLDSKAMKFGVRQMTWSEEGGDLRLWVNGRRFIARGGNWGFGESMLRYRGREYDAAVRYHREMNFTMIRNWVGQIGDDAFWEACDRHGIMVWQDFWLANPWDGPDPDDNAMFLNNVRDFVLRIRNHPSIGLYCGRNEGFPPKVLEEGIRKILGECHAGIHYIPSSADQVVSGHGPYHAMPSSFYFRAADKKLHSEVGAPTIPPIESVRMMMSEQALWPQSLSWGLHDFCLQGAQGGASFRATIDNGYGGAENAEEWLRLAQFVNYDAYRAIFEAQSRYRMGALLWMSHSCWPSFVWQTYDYYFEPTAAYFGCKKGSEPLHIQWNCQEETIEVVNYSAGNQSGLLAEVEVLNLDGKRIDLKTAAVESREDSTASCIRMRYPTGLTPVHFLRLRLLRGEEALSSNFYLRGIQEGDFRAIRELPKASVKAATKVEQKDEHWLLTTEVRNDSRWPALMVRLKAVREKSGDRILPAIYSDNYIALMPGESRSITTEVNVGDARAERPAIVVA
jgi:hypothetical protein